MFGKIAFFGFIILFFVVLIITVLCYRHIKDLKHKISKNEEKLQENETDTKAKESKSVTFDEILDEVFGNDDKKTVKNNATKTNTNISSNTIVTTNNEIKKFIKRMEESNEKRKKEIFNNFNIEDKDFIVIDCKYTKAENVKKALKELIPQNKSVNNKFVVKLCNVITSYCEIKQDFDHGSEFNYENLQNNTTETSKYVIYTFKNDLETKNAIKYSDKQLFNPIKYFEKTKNNQNKLLIKEKMSKNVFSLGNKKNISKIFSADSERAFDYMLNICKRQYDIEVNRTNENLTLIIKQFFDEFTSQRKEYKIEQLTDVFMKKYNSITIFGKETLDKYYENLKNLDKDTCEIHMRVFSKIIYIFAKLNLFEFLTYCCQCGLIKNDEYCSLYTKIKPTYTEYRFLLTFLSNDINQDAFIHCDMEYNYVNDEKTNKMRMKCSINQGTKYYTHSSNKNCMKIAIKYDI
ncbi:hypothetical protein BDAP_000610 [Binucleata daphniae]